MEGVREICQNKVSFFPRNDENTFNFSQSSWFYGAFGTIIIEPLKQENKINPVGCSYFKEVDLLDNFEIFLISRTKYLDSLKTIGDNWISGNSTQPNIFVIEKSKQILNSIHEFKKSQYNKLIITNILLSPIPNGGVSIEIIINQFTSIYVSLLNNKSVELELSVNGLFSDFSVNEIDSEDFIISLIHRYALKYEYSK